MEFLISYSVAIFVCLCVVGVVGFKAPRIRARQERELQNARREQAKDSLIVITNQMDRLFTRMQSGESPTAGEIRAIEDAGNAWVREFGDIVSPELEAMQREIAANTSRAVWGVS